MRIDGALTPPGLIARAKMHTLICQDDRVYVLYTGPGPTRQIDYSRAMRGYRVHQGILENLAVSALLRRYIMTIKEAEAKIREDNLDELAAQKHSFAFPKAAITEVSVRVTPVDVRLTFRVDKRKFKFDCSLDDRAQVEDYAKLLGAVT